MSYIKSHYRNVQYSCRALYSSNPVINVASFDNGYFFKAKQLGLYV